jgi:transposase-like protein
MPNPYAEFRRRALDLVRSGRPIVQVANELCVSAQALYNWRRQDEVDRGERAEFRFTDTHTGDSAVWPRSSATYPSPPPDGQIANPQPVIRALNGNSS